MPNKLKTQSVIMEAEIKQEEAIELESEYSQLLKRYPEMLKGDSDNVR